MPNRKWTLFFLLALPVAFTSVRAQAKPTASIDSLTFERTPCYGTCPAYQLHVNATGAVFFQSLNAGDSTRTARDQISAASWAHLSTLVSLSDLHALPDDVTKDRALCPDEATDHPGAIITVFRGSQRKQVRDYYGCYANSDHTPIHALDRLRLLETAIDSVTQVKRWARPGKFRP